ncbi:MAG: DUF1851 domain-containing protein [Chloroflexi bacterium]|nr:DUF1851 domain-containing protein [Chloroflexota bacterium]
MWVWALVETDFTEDALFRTLFSEALIALGELEGSDSCYAFRVPLLLGGDFSVENLAIESFRAQVGFLSELHQ